MTSPREPKGRGAAWTEERGTSDEGRQRLKSAPEASGIAEHWPGRLVSLGDYQVYVRSVPDPQDPGEPALCVHGLEGSSRNWTDLMDLLRPRLACEAVDLPGFGDSPPRPDGSYSIAALAQTVIALIERTGHAPIHLLGNSLGGAVCVKVAATRPDLIRTLTLISPALPDARLRLDLLRFPLMSVPGVGARLLRQLAQLPPERRVADVIANCYSDPRRFGAARFAAEVAALTRRDTLGYAADALVGSVRALTAETLRGGVTLGRVAWRETALITAPSLVTSRTWNTPAWSPPTSPSCSPPRTAASRAAAPRTRAPSRSRRGNSRSLPPVDRGTCRERQTPDRSEKKDLWSGLCRCPRWSNPPMS
jgi:pimeloyl-ACP methyl ester carboxylesterase